MYQRHNGPACGSTNLVKNGSTYYGKARLKCRPSGRQFVHIRNYQPSSNECKRWIELMLAERISLEAICRVMEIAAHQLYTYMDELYGETPTDLGYSFTSHSTDIELVMLNFKLDELWTFVGRPISSGYGWP